MLQSSLKKCKNIPKPYTGVVNPFNEQRNVGNCMRGRKTENEKNIK